MAKRLNYLGILNKKGLLSLNQVQEAQAREEDEY